MACAYFLVAPHYFFSQGILDFLRGFEVIKLSNCLEPFLRRLHDLRGQELDELSKSLVLKACLASLTLSTPAIINAIVVSLDRLAFRRTEGTEISVFVVLALAASLSVPMSLMAVVSNLSVRKRKAYNRMLSMLQVG